MAKMTMNMRIKGLTELVAAVSDPAITALPMERMFVAVTDEGQTVAQEASRSQLVASSMLTEASPTSGRIYSTLPQAQAAAIDRGRAPSRVRGGKGVPVDVLAAWASRNGISGDAVFPIAQAIRQRGIKGRFFMRAARTAMRRRLPELLTRAGAEITTAIAQRTNAGTWEDAT